MAQVAVTIGGKSYRISCDESDEPRLVALAEVVNAQVEDMRSRFGEIGDRRLLIMAAISIADELVETTRRVRDLESSLEKTEAEPTKDESDERITRLAAGLEEAAERIERITDDLCAALEPNRSTNVVAGGSPSGSDGD
jgi:cell division protein ZapA